VAIVLMTIHPLLEK